jgi:methyltransferase (TIGR00027 family)
MPQSLGGPSRTAILTAAARAMHRDEPPPWVLDDTLALTLAGSEGAALRGRLRAELSPGQLLGFTRWVCVRSRLPEDVLERAVGDGVRQYVILGAGLDSFAYRRHDLVRRVRVFEVDHPETQSWKRARLEELGIEVPPQLVFAPVDFERQTLREGLAAAGFDFGAPAVFSWLGVTMYLTLEAIEATLRTVAACRRGTRIVLTYDLPPDTLGQMGQATRAFLDRIVTEMGEPFVSVFEPEAAEALVRRLGFDQVRHFGPGRRSAHTSQGAATSDSAAASGCSSQNAPEHPSPTARAQGHSADVECAPGVSASTAQ